MVKMGFFFSDGLVMIESVTIDKCVEMAKARGKFTGCYVL